MKTLYIIGNWKSNKTTSEAIEWLQNFKFQISNFKFEKNKVVLVCASYTLLPSMNEYITKNNLSINLCAQDVSPFAPGPFTGEVNALQIKEFADYVLIGHSERRDNFGETDSLLAKKVEQACKAGLFTFFCVQGADTPVPEGVSVIAYEPPGAISTVSKGVPDDPKKVIKVIKALKEKYPSTPVIYGGSVNPENVSSFTSFPEIQGALPGAASLDPQKFFNIIQNA